MKIFRKYFDLSNEGKEDNLGINILNLGHNIHPMNAPYPDISQHPDSYYFDWEKGRSLKEYQIIYISKGSGFFEANGMKPRLIEGGTIILIYPNVWHRYCPNENTGWEEYWVGFSGSYAQYLLEQACFSPQNPIIGVGFNNEFLETFSKLIDLIETKHDTNQKLSSFLLIQLLGIVYASALLSNQKRTKKEELIQEVVVHIHENWAKTIDFQMLSNRFNVSYSWFRKSFKEVLGTSPNQYQLMLKIRKAEQLIQETNLTISEIAYQTGFDSEFYFSKLFKQKMSINASEIRKKLKN
jgi:AraC-like DNA-binding protein